MNRGDLVTATLPGDFGKPRPALIIQADAFDHLSSVTVLPLTTFVLDAPSFRVAIAPSTGNGLREPSQVMVDKAYTLHRRKIGYVIGRLADADMLAVNRALALFFGLA
jgi:mRNA interferase MazF